jgi:ESS family glutamate:Na+ symporter
MIELDLRQTVILAILTLFLGKLVTHRFGFLRKYNVPEPVSGGIIAALASAALFFVAGTEVQFDLGARDTLLVMFFTALGLSSRLSALREGGLGLVILLCIAVAYLFLQDLTGMAVAMAAGLPAAGGLIAGSVSLSGGHGTAIGWAPVFAERFAIGNALELGVACATFGLVLGGIIGGPIARFLIERHGLESSESRPAVGIPYAEEEQVRIDLDSVLNTLLVVSLAIGLGLQLNHLAGFIGLQLPTFVTSLLAGIVMTNTIPLLFPRIRWPTGTPTLALLSDLCLSAFLAMSLMSLQLWAVLALGGPLLLLLLAQTLLIAAFVVIVVFNLMGRSYDAAVICAGYAGLALGATPTAIANMTAVAKTFGPSSRAFVIVPLIGAFFIDVANAVVIQTLVSWLD